MAVAECAGPWAGARRCWAAGTFGPAATTRWAFREQHDRIVTLLLRGGTGLETDSGDFSAIPVVIG
ncbi:MAG TPA: hypothetical protein VES40_13120 [Ilumatobacteraceae bacterium]|nr:hypothetical protein [Ilumatobacteraceae bacterium]